MDTSKEKSGTNKRDNQSGKGRVARTGSPEEHTLEEEKRAEADAGTVSAQRGEMTKESNLQERWEEIKADFRNRYKEITDEDVVYRTDRPGSFGEMLGRIEKRIGRNREQLRYDINQWNPTDTRK